MRNRLLIDGNDAFTRYGVFIEEGGLAQVVQPPVFKSLDSVDWPEDDGVEVDLDEPVLDSRTIQIPFCITDVDDAGQLFTDLSDGAYHLFNFAELGITLKLRMTQNGSFSQLVRLGKMTLTFCDDSPQVPSAPIPFAYGEGGFMPKGYVIDDVDLTQYGVYVLQGTETSIRRAAATKTNLTISTKNDSGIIYDGAQVRFKTKDIQLNLLITAPDIDAFWKRWDALFSVMMHPNARKFSVSWLAGDFDCYYKSAQVSRFRLLPGARVWCEFSLNLTILSWRPTDAMLLLATEEGEYITTESGDYIKIKTKSH